MIRWVDVAFVFPLVFLGRLGWLLAEDVARTIWAAVVLWAKGRRETGKTTIRVA